MASRRPASRIRDLLQHTVVCTPPDGMASTRPRACVRGQRTCSVSCNSSCSEAGERQSRQDVYRTWLCRSAVASRRRCWWLCCSSSARCTGRVDCRPRGGPQWRAPGATDADATRHQVGARPSDLDHRLPRRAGYPGMAVRPDESIFPKSCVVLPFSLLLHLAPLWSSSSRQDAAGSARDQRL